MDSMAKQFSEETLEAFHNSLDRCQSNSQFLDLFYDRFINSSSDITALFSEVDLLRLKRMLRQSLIVVLMASEGSVHSQERIKSLSLLHLNLGVRRVHYDVWLDTLIAVVEEIDPQYDIQVEESWRAVMGVGVAIMKEPLGEVVARS